jgi:DNA-binding CsgD family transcriptional regulator
MPSRGSARKLALERPGRPRRGPPTSSLRLTGVRSVGALREGGKDNGVRGWGYRHRRESEYRSRVIASLSAGVAFRDLTQQFAASLPGLTPRAALRSQEAVAKLGVDREPPGGIPMDAPRAIPYRGGCLDAAKEDPMTRPAQVIDPAGLPFLRFVQALRRCTSLEELGRAFTAGFGRLLAVPMFGFNVVHPGTTRLRHTNAVHVSDVFVERYIREVMDEDPLRVGAHESGRAVYNLGLMSPLEWEESEAYRRAFHLQRMRHVVEAPMMVAGEPVGSVHFATSAHEHDLGVADIQLTEALADAMAQTVVEIDSLERLTRERDEARVALDVAGVAVVVSDLRAMELRLNDAARMLVRDVADADERLHRLLGRRGEPWATSRRVEVELVTGEAGTLQADCTPLDGGVVGVLALLHDHPRISPPMLAGLTPREAEVAQLVVDGLADREIAEQLFLSRHTVSQYVKRIYRKLDVESRVGLTRLLLGASTVRSPAT